MSFLGEHMHRALLVIFVACLAATEACGQQTQRIISIPDLMIDMPRFRRAIVRDSTPLNFCAIPEAFDASGKLLSPPGAPPARYASRDACRDTTADRARGDRRVDIRSIRQIGDTLVVSCYTDRGGIKYFDEFRYFIASGVRERRYVIGPIIED